MCALTRSRIQCTRFLLTKLFCKFQVLVRPLAKCCQGRTARQAADRLATQFHCNTAHAQPKARASLKYHSKQCLSWHYHLRYAMQRPHPTHHQTKVLVAHEAFHSSEGSLSTPRVGGPSKCNQERVDPPSPQIQCSFASDSSDSALVHPHIKGRHLLHVTRHRAQCQVLFPSIQDPVKTCQGQRIDFSGFAPHR